jgi:hypothetical protein
VIDEITRTVLGWFNIELADTDQEPAERPDYDQRPRPPHHLGPNGRPPKYKEN